MKRSDVEALIRQGDVLSPVLATELLKSLDTLPDDTIAQLGQLLITAGDADKAFGRASLAYLTCIQAIEHRALSRVVDEEQQIMQEFERQLSIKE